MRRPFIVPPAIAYMAVLTETARRKGQTPKQFAKEHPRLVCQVTLEVQAYVVLGKDIIWN
jgi:hypothetical protein